MTDTIKRRNLFAVSATPAPLPEEAIAAVAARNGFPDSVSAPQTAAAPTPDQAGTTRRQRQPKGRDHQFNTRLRRDTLDFIYSEANGRNIPIAQVIEEGMEALKLCRGS